MLPVPVPVPPAVLSPAAGAPVRRLADGIPDPPVPNPPFGQFDLLVVSVGFLGPQPLSMLDPLSWAKSSPPLRTSMAATTARASHRRLRPRAAAMPIRPRSRLRQPAVGPQPRTNPVKGRACCPVCRHTIESLSVTVERAGHDAAGARSPTAAPAGGWLAPLWTLTTGGLVLATSSWAAFWAQAVTGIVVLPPEIPAALFFLGVALGARDQRRRRLLRLRLAAGGEALRQSDELSHLSHAVRFDRAEAVAPAVADIGRHGGDLLIAEPVGEGGHHAAAEQDQRDHIVADSQKAIVAEAGTDAAVAELAMADETRA